MRKARRNRVIRAAAAFQNAGLGKALLVGREEMIRAGIRRAGVEDEHARNPRAAFGAGSRSPISKRSTSACSAAAALYRDAVRMVTNDRNVYAASMLAAGDADAMVTGVTRNYATALSDVRMVLDPPKGQRPDRRAW